jgi:hypothetical protein
VIEASQGLFDGAGREHRHGDRLEGFAGGRGVSGSIDQADAVILEQSLLLGSEADNVEDVIFPDSAIRSVVGSVEQIELGSAGIVGCLSGAGPAPRVTMSTRRLAPAFTARHSTCWPDGYVEEIRARVHRSDATGSGWFRAAHLSSVDLIRAAKFGGWARVKDLSIGHRPFPILGYDLKRQNLRLAPSGQARSFRLKQVAEVYMPVPVNSHSFWSPN